MTSYADGIVLISNGTNVVTVFNDIKNKGCNVFNWFSKKNFGKSSLLLTSMEETF